MCRSLWITPRETVGIPYHIYEKRQGFPRVYPAQDIHTIKKEGHTNAVIHVTLRVPPSEELVLSRVKLTGAKHGERKKCDAPVTSIFRSRLVSLLDPRTHGAHSRLVGDDPRCWPVAIETHNYQSIQSYTAARVWLCLNALVWLCLAPNFCACNVPVRKVI